MTLCDWAWRHGLVLTHGDVWLAVDRFDDLLVRLSSLTLDEGHVVSKEDEDE